MGAAAFARRGGRLAGRQAGGDSFVDAPGLPGGQALVEGRRVTVRPGGGQPAGQLIRHDDREQRVTFPQEGPARAEQPARARGRSMAGRDLGQAGQRQGHASRAAQLPPGAQRVGEQRPGRRRRHPGLFQPRIQQQQGQVPLVGATTQQRQAGREPGPGLPVFPPLRREQPEAAEHDAAGYVVPGGFQITETRFEQRARCGGIALQQRGTALVVAKVGVERLPVGVLHLAPHGAGLVEQVTRLRQLSLAGTHAGQQAEAVGQPAVIAGRAEDVDRRFFAAHRLGEVAAPPQLQRRAVQQRGPGETAVVRVRPAQELGVPRTGLLKPA